MHAVPFLLVVFGQIPAIESKDFDKEQQKAAVLATVRVVNSRAKAEGSGVVISQSRGFLYVLTAHHLVGDAEQVEVSFYSAKSYPKPDRQVRTAPVIARAKDPDLALIRIETAVPAAVLRVCPKDAVPADQDFPVLSVGCDGGPPNCALDRVGEKKRVRRGREDAATLVWEVASAPAQGRSGGPLVDRRGHVIGVCSGASDGKGYYSHPDEIHRFLKQSGYKWLYEPAEK
jgi:S1-C subfamily serine protease